MPKSRSTEELEQLANITVDHNIPVKLYFRSAELLLKQARVYKLENDLEHAYILYMKYTNLGVNELPKHPGYKKPENKKNIRALNKNCLEALEALESIKPKLNETYNRYHQQNQVVELESVREKPSKDEDQANTPAEHKLDGQTIDRLDDSLKEWSLQDALKGVAGIGYNEPFASDHSHATYRPYGTTEYPSLSIHNQSDNFSYQAPQPSYRPMSVHSVLPTLPPKILPQHQQHPAIPPKVPIASEKITPALPPKIKLSSGPTVDASSERGEPLRRLILPKRLQTRFLSIAEPNTRKKIETCGILAGKLKNNILKITTLIIPKQIGTSDTCTTENEEELFDVQDKYDLLTFGWIHTHPTQSCFLSSVDLHTHCSYQLMLPEAIAIVCSPSQEPDFGIFRLTDPPGLDIISNCKRQPAFHPHPDLPIYTDVMDDGHVKTLDYDFDILDLRK
ncbi:Putative Ubiquitin thiolesterase [Rhizopus microsporus]|nr:Putative Ubiquitin thiolesterase [Rhizopus microsporus]